MQLNNEDKNGVLTSACQLVGKFFSNLKNRYTRTASPEIEDNTEIPLAMIRLDVHEDTSDFDYDDPQEQLALEEETGGSQIKLLRTVNVHEDMINILLKRIQALEGDKEIDIASIDPIETPNSHETLNDISAFDDNQDWFDSVQKQIDDINAQLRFARTRFDTLTQKIHGLGDMVEDLSKDVEEIAVTKDKQDRAEMDNLKVGVDAKFLWQIGMVELKSLGRRLLRDKFEMVQTKMGERTNMLLVVVFGLVFMLVMFILSVTLPLVLRLDVLLSLGLGCAATCLLMPW